MASLRNSVTVSMLLCSAIACVDAAALAGCDDQNKPAAPQPQPKPTAPTSSTPNTATTPTPTPPPKPANKTTEVTISKTKYTLEVAADNDTRMLGLGGRTEIPEHGGMIFAFPPKMVGVQNFVMRDCPIDIDIIYTDGVGRVLAFHEMKSDPRKGDEGVPGLLDPTKMTDEQKAAAVKYENRLAKYSSKYPATFAIELRAGSIKKLGVREGDLVTMDHAGLKKMAK